MSVSTDTVSGRVEGAFVELTPAQMAIALALIVALGGTLMLVQEPAVHDSLHNFRHMTGITCH
jgi:hypothetical protein